MAGGLCPSCLLGLGLEAGGLEPAGRVSANRAEAAAKGQSDRAVSGHDGGRCVGRYRLLEVLGEGGFGVVWLAEQAEPVWRRVALKLIKPGMDTRQVVARFEAERQALALMDHPNIARVLDGGETEHGRPFFVMELVPGTPITEYCDAHRLTTDQRLELFIPVCQAVQHAHQKGILHRDLKPSNILVAEVDGKPVPKVIDFGVARAVEEPLTDKTLVTRAHQFLGTPDYMSPEQAGLDGLDVDSRTDVYSLGVVLYELLTSRTPLDTRGRAPESHDAVLRRVRDNDPLKPSTRWGTLDAAERAAAARKRGEDPKDHDRRLRGDLDWIVLKAIERDRDRRYATVNGLAADLRRYLDNEPVAARPPSSLDRFRKVIRRHRALAAATSAVSLALVAGLITTTWQWLRARQYLTEARLNAYASEMVVAQRALAEGNLEHALRLLGPYRSERGEQDLRGFEWRYLWEQSRDRSRTTFTNASPVAYPECAVAFSPDGRFFAHGGSGLICVRDGRHLRILTNLTASAHTLSFSPDSGFLVAALVEPTREGARLWETRDWSPVEAARLAGARGPALFSPDGRWLLTGTPDQARLELRNTRDWEVEAWCPQTKILANALRGAVAFSPDGRLLVTPEMDFPTERGDLLLWQVPPRPGLGQSRGEPRPLALRATLSPPGHPFQSARFLPGTNGLLTATWRGYVLTWDLSGPEPRVTRELREHTAGTPAIAVSPDGAIIATGSTDQSICLWDARTVRFIGRLRGHRREVWSLAFSPDGETLASSSADGSVRLWEPRAGGGRVIVEETGFLGGFSSDGRTAVTVPTEGNPRWVTVRDGKRTVIPIPRETPLQFDFDLTYGVGGDAPLGALGRADGQVEIWDLSAGRREAVLSAGTHRITATLFTRDGQTLATGDASGQLCLWGVPGYRRLRSFQASKSSVCALAFSRHGDLLAVGNYFAPGVHVWHLPTQREVMTLPVMSNQLDFAPDGHALATCSVNGNEAFLWAIPSGRLLATFKGHVGGTTQVAFSHDGLTLATGAYDGAIKLWNVATRREVASLVHEGTLNGLRFSPDGRTLAASYWMFPGIPMRLEFFQAPLREEIDARNGASDPRPGSAAADR